MNKHSKVEDLNFLKPCVLKVNIHCEGCKKKVKKQLQKIDGVFTITIDAEQGKVTVNGNVNPSILIKKLNKAGKHAELWPAKKNNIGNGEIPHQLPKHATDAAKGQQLQKPLKSSEGKDQKLQQLQKELKDMNLPFSNGEKSAKFPVFDQELDDGSGFDDEFDADDDFFDESDDSSDDFDDDKSDVKFTSAAPKKIVTVKQGGGEVHSKSNGNGGTHGSCNSGVRQGKGNGDNSAGDGGGKNDVKSHGLVGVPTTGRAPNGFFNKGMAAAQAVAQPVPGGGGYAYQQQLNMAEMMQQQKMMTNGYPIAYGYPMRQSESYTSYFSDENTSGGCSIM